MTDISQSELGSRFVLKGASLFLVWFGHAFRTTRDVDLLGKARIDLQVDVGFGDAITPEPERVTFPTLLDGPAPVLLAYPPYTAIAEKFQAMVVLDMANSRMKDFYDICVMFRSFPLDAEILAKAIQRTFARRGMALPGKMPMALTPDFSEDPLKQIQWNAFVKKSRLTVPMGDLPNVVAELRGHLHPMLRILEMKTE